MMASGVKANIMVVVGWSTLTVVSIKEILSMIRLVARGYNMHPMVPSLKALGKMTKVMERFSLLGWMAENLKVRCLMESG